MASFLSTNKIFKTIRGQVESQLGEDIDAVMTFDGSLQEAVEAHFAQSKRTHNDAVIFFGFSDDAPDAKAGDGAPLRQEMIIDFYIVTRASGRDKYGADIERLYDLSDEMMFNVFDHANRTADMKTVCPVMQFVHRRRVVTGSQLLSHVLRFIAIPKRG